MAKFCLVDTAYLDLYSGASWSPPVAIPNSCLLKNCLLVFGASLGFVKYPPSCPSKVPTLPALSLWILVSLIVVLKISSGLYTVGFLTLASILFKTELSTKIFYHILRKHLTIDLNPYDKWIKDIKTNISKEGIYILSEDCEKITLPLCFLK